MNFDRFFGNQKLKDDITSAFQNGNPPHAILLEGEKGLGKKNFATYLAAAYLCKGNVAAGIPCFQCSHCKKVFKHVHPDVYVRQGDGTGKSLGVDVVREVVSKAQEMPNEANCKVFVFEDADIMTPQAQNALLKTLEEPPADCKFIITVDSKSSMLTTILSRTTCYKVMPVTFDEAKDFLVDKYREDSVEELEREFKFTGGNIGKFIEMREDETWQKISEIMPIIVRGIYAPKESELLFASAKLEKDKELLSAVLENLVLIIRDAVLLKDCNNTMSAFEQEAKSLSESMSTTRLMALMDVCEEIKNLIYKNANKTLLATAFCYKLRSAAGL